jgi:hypothetical protein
MTDGAQVVVLRGKEIPVSPERTAVTFTGGEQGPQEAGRYFFWATFGQDDFGPWVSTGRALDSLPPEDRMQRVEHEQFPNGNEKDPHNDLDSRAIYAAIWRRLPTAQGIRAATYREVANWMASHKADAIYACAGWVCQDVPMAGVPPKEIV